VNFSPAIAGMWHDQADNDANTQWVRNYWTELHPFSAPGGYINFMDPDDQARISDNYADNHDRLAQVKKTYEPNQRSPRAPEVAAFADRDLTPTTFPYAFLDATARMILKSARGR
jgi:hypothetical protein